MAGVPKPIFSVAALILLAVLYCSRGPAAEALAVSGENVTQMFVSGKVCCSPDGGLVGAILGAPASGAKISVVLNGVVIASATTAADGSFNICVNSGEVLSIITNICYLKVIVSLPVLTCPVLATATGTLEGVPVIVGTILGGVCNLAVNSFTHVLIN